jgi:peptidyl-dipeptidase A
MKKDYARFAELSNKGAKEMGFADTGAMWRSKYDMPADDFTKELDRLWAQVRPLYLKLHAYVRVKLHESTATPQRSDSGAHTRQHLGAGLVEHRAARRAGERRSRLLAHRHPEAAQHEPHRDGASGRALLHVRGFPGIARLVLAAIAVRQAAGSRSGLPRERLGCRSGRGPPHQDVHPPDGGGFPHDPPRAGPQLLPARSKLPAIFRDSADDGFHEAIGDNDRAVGHAGDLVRIKMSTRRPTPRDLGLLMNKALEKIAFLPFGLLVDQWRWKVFSGEVKPENYNKAWWELRQKYQGVAPVGARGDEFFDPGAKYHVPGNTPYSRYFLAAILQFQFHRALSKIAGCTSPLNRCSIYESAEAAAAERDAVDGAVTSLADAPKR